MQAIGVFDSGLGGLTVVRELRRQLPDEAVLYLGDTARVPYGSKSSDTVLRYSRNSARFLLERNVKLMLVACNTASAFALAELQRETPIPVLGAVTPGAEEAVAATRTGSIGVIGTLGTVRSGSYPRAIADLAGTRPDVEMRVTGLACPLFVPLVEEGWLGDGDGRTEDRVTEAVAERYLSELRDRCADLDVLVLGCTHYPLLRGLLDRVSARLWRHPIRIVDSAGAMARAAKRILGKSDGVVEGAPGALHCCVTDETRLAELGTRFLGHTLDAVERVDLA